MNEESTVICRSAAGGYVMCVRLGDSAVVLYYMIMILARGLTRGPS